MTMLRSSSPAMSEISVGSPSPPPPLHSTSVSTNGFHVLNIKRLRPSVEIIPTQSLKFPPPIALPQHIKSSAERVKSFSIADILGKREHEEKTSVEIKTNLNKRSGTPPSKPLALASIPATHNMPPHILAERLQPVPHSAPAPLLMLDLPGLHKVIPTAWDPAAAGNPNTSPPSLPIHHFFPPALLHYEQRLAWDYQRQLQEHFQAQAQLLRQMSMDPNIIPSEDGSERSRSSSAGSQCYSPDVNVAGDDDDEEEEEGEEDSVGNCSRNDDRLPANRDKSDSNAKNLDDKSKKIATDTPLDALFQLSTKNFDEDQDPATLNIFATRPNPKKKRKSRTAFTNHQIFELEKRFLYQKYLSPADRDEIAAGLGLSNAQVITWFQNRRAKLKRDMEELKKDVESVKQLSAHKSFLENVNDLSILKTRPVSRHQQPPTAPQHPPHSEVHSAALTHGNHTTGVYSNTTSSGRLSAAAAAAAGTTGINISTVQQLSQQHQQHLNTTTTTTTNTCNESRDESGNSSGSSEESLQTQQQNPQLLNRQQQQQLQQHQYQPRNLQINHSRG